MKKAETPIDMAKYVESEPIHDKCNGCANIFDFEFASSEGEVLIQEKKCLIYSKPSCWWRERDIATKKVLVRTKANPKGEFQILPAAEFYCPKATHLTVSTETVKAKINPLKASKRRRR